MRFAAIVARYLSLDRFDFASACIICMALGKLKIYVLHARQRLEQIEMHWSPTTISLL